MRNLNLLNIYRDCSPEVFNRYGSYGDHKTGVFLVKRYTDSLCFRVIASSEMGWDHVSVSLPARCPTWEEMEHIKRMFFKDDEVAMQLHVTPKEHINVHPYCLHLWRPTDQAIPLPPAIMVG